MLILAPRYIVPVAELICCCPGDIIFLPVVLNYFPKDLGNYFGTSAPAVSHPTRPKWTDSRPQCATPVFIIISTQEALHALQSKCHPVYIALLSCKWGLLSKAFRKSRHVGDEAIRRAGMKKLLSSSEHCCLSLLPDKAKCLLICLITVLMSDGFFMGTAGGKKSAIDLLW